MNEYNDIQGFSNNLGEITFIHRNNVAGMTSNQIEQSGKYTVDIYLINPLNSAKDGIRFNKALSFSVPCDNLDEVQKHIDWFSGKKITLWYRLKYFITGVVMAFKIIIGKE